MSEFFDEDASSRLEGIYRTEDALRRRRIARQALAASDGERVLDVGCGPGFYCEELAAEIGPSGSVVGVDDSEAMLALATRRCDELANVELLNGTATSLPVEDGGFDAALCIQVLEYIADSAVALAELYRALRPGGRVLVWDIDWETTSLHADDPVLTERVLEAWDEHLVHRSLPRTLGPLMESEGFTNIEMQPHAFATNQFDRQNFGPALIPFIATFVAGRNDLTKQDTEAWVAEQERLGERGEFFFSVTQFCFTATKP